MGINVPGVLKEYENTHINMVEVLAGKIIALVK
jgi:hypothetical protein